MGVDQIIAESGVAKSTLYAHFRTKDDLIAAYLRHTDDSWMGKLQAAAEAAGTDPADVCLVNGCRICGAATFEL